MTGKRWGPGKDLGHQVDNSTSTIKKLSILYSDPELSDLRLCIGERTFHAHKLILSISSDVFKTMLTSPTWPEAFTSQISLEEEPECQDVFEDFLQYLYTGRIHLSQTSVLPILILADKYNINDLSDVCINYMSSHCVAPPSQSRVISWLKYAIMCDHKQLQEICEEYITWNFQYVMNTPDFMGISSDMLIKFLRSSDIIVDDEYTLYEKVKLWFATYKELKSNSKKLKSKLKNIIRSVVPLIKFPMILHESMNSLGEERGYTESKDVSKDNWKLKVQEQIHHLCTLLNEQTKGENVGRKPNLHSQLISNTDSVPAAQDQESGDISSFSSFSHHMSFNPRIYTSDTWSTEIFVPDVKSLNQGDVLRAFFSTPISGPGGDDFSMWDWHVDFYPKGVIFKPCVMIGHFWNHEIDEVVYDTVRLTVTSNSPEHRQVQISVLIFGQQEGIEFVAKCVTKSCYFDSEHLSHNFNDLIDLSDLYHRKSPFLLDAERNALKIKIVIKPKVSF
ncbi:BTB/POZ domain-containing protein 17-like [Saccostrea echinata]|uniref:BTB/POZ domain-containing protein 17-like n=1 Tax=Saccostrea echinata TaxID=191078 RepID=UPI002A83B5ED|nr:BTB/POZ domain-containing protein 17-like [Saccostrea echinata]